MSVLIDQQGAIGSMTLHRPDKAHAYHRDMLEQLEQGIATLSGARVVLVASTGDGAFCGGADLKEIHQREPGDVDFDLSQRVFDQLAQASFVSIAVVQGPAVGGGAELALACDFRVLGPHASFKFPEVGLGLIPAAGGCTRLTRLLGPARAKQLVLLAEELTAPTALAWGLATKVATDPMAEAMRLARQLVAKPHVALTQAKRLIDDGPTLPGEQEVQTHLTKLRGPNRE